jgi:hypothetical protein
VALAFTIDGVTVYPVKGSVSCLSNINGRDRLRLTIRSLDASYRPAKNKELIVTEGATRVFGGITTTMTERGIVANTTPGILTEVEALDFSSYADRVTFTGTLAAGTLKSMLTTLVGAS